MNPDTLYTVANQNEATRSQLSELDELIGKYPWFSVAHLLKAKGMLENNDPDYPEQLQRASVHINNRQVLFNYLHDHSEFIESESNNSATSGVETDIAEDTIESLETKEPSANDETAVKPSLDLQEEPLEVEEIREVDSLVPAFVSPQVEADLDSNEIDQPSANDEPQVIEPEIESPQPIEERELGPEAEVDPELEKDILTFAVSRIIEKEVQEEISAEEGVDVVSPSTSISDEESELSPFARRLLKGAAKVGYGAPMHDNGSETNIESKKESNQKLSSGELVDTFIRTSPRITPSRAPEYSPRDLAKHSLVEDDSFVTETMAKIYAQQTNRSVFLFRIKKAPAAGTYTTGCLEGP